ncbi:MAG: ion transporter [Saprospiraceae bacterium]|nr:ion transporter [Saprospiraceae bacterium]
MSTPRDFSPLRENIYRVIFEADTRKGKAFDVWLLFMIVASVLTVFLESVPSLNARYENVFKILEWIFTIFFTIEYILRIYSVLKPIKYVTSFYGVIDLLSILPTYLSLLIEGSQVGSVIRILRLLRVFRIFKLNSFMYQGAMISSALMRSRRKITVFLYFVFLLVIIIGSFMYLIEHNGPSADEFDSIPRSIYWAIVTITTVGYGDISPSTNFGQFIAALVMVMGYAIIAVPTGIVSSELISYEKKNNTQVCPHCTKEGHDDDATYCKHCGEFLFNDIRVEDAGSGKSSDEEASLG